jgi:alpha-amylase
MKFMGIALLDLLKANTMSTTINTMDNRQLTIVFRVHQPFRLKSSPISDPDSQPYCLNDKLDQEIMEHVARHCYIPTNALLLKLIEQYPQIKISFAISGTALEQMEMYAPQALEGFRALASTGSVDFLSVPYYQSLAFLMDGEEFEIQILEHAEKIQQHFGKRPEVFLNTNFIYNDDIGRRITMMGFNGVLTEGSDRMRHVCAHHLYEHRDVNGLKLLLRNPHLSNDIAFHVAAPYWNLTAEKYMSWLEAMPENEKLVNISVDYETFGEHNKPETGIFEFLEHILLMLAMQNNYRMATVSDITQRYAASRPLSIPDYVSISGSDLSDWVGNEMQREAFSMLISLETPVKKLNQRKLLHQWRALHAIDHFCYMSEKGSHLSPYQSTQEAFHTYMSAINCLAQAVYEGTTLESDPEKINEAMEAERRNLNAPVWAMSIDPRSGYSS